MVLYSYILEAERDRISYVFRRETCFISINSWLVFFKVKRDLAFLVRTRIYCYAFSNFYNLKNLLKKKDTRRRVPFRAGRKRLMIVSFKQDTQPQEGRMSKNSVTHQKEKRKARKVINFCEEIHNQRHEENFIPLCRFFYSN